MDGFSRWGDFPRRGHREKKRELQTNKQKLKVRQPQRAAKSKRPNAPSDGSKNNGIHTTKQEEYPSRHPTTDTANSSTSKQITSRRLIGVSKSNTIQSTNQAGGPVSPPHMYHQLFKEAYFQRVPMVSMF